MTSLTASHISAPPGASSTRSYQRIKRVMRDDIESGGANAGTRLVQARNGGKNTTNPPRIAHFAK